MCVLELERSLPSAGAEPPDAPGEIADAVTALRLATAGPIAAGPVLFERLDWRPFGVRPDAPDRGDAASRRADAARRLSRRGRALVARAGSRRPRTTASSATRSTAGSSRSSRTAPFRAEQLRSALECAPRRRRRIVGGGAPRGGPARRERARAREPACRRCGACGDGVADDEAADLVRRALVETLSRGDRRKLVAELDESLLGVRAQADGPRRAGGRKLIRTRHICGRRPRG